MKWWASVVCSCSKTLTNSNVVRVETKRLFVFKELVTMATACCVFKFQESIKREEEKEEIFGSNTPDC